MKFDDGYVNPIVPLLHPPFQWSFGREPQPVWKNFPFIVGMLSPNHSIFHICRVSESTKATFHDDGLDCERSWHSVPGSSDLNGAMSYALYSNEMEQLAAEEHSDQDCAEDGGPIRKYLV